MRSVLALSCAAAALWCVAASSRFWVAAPARPLVFSPAAQPVALYPQGAVPLVLEDGFLAARAPLVYQRAPVVFMQEPGSRGREGATVDQDGKSNVWAVEPTLQVERDGSGEAKGGIKKFLPFVLVAAVAALSLPLLPLLFASNPDQI